MKHALRATVVAIALAGATTTNSLAADVQETASAGATESAAAPGAADAAMSSAPRSPHWAIPGAYVELDLPRIGEPGDDGFAVAETPTSPIRELDEMEAMRRSVFDVPWLERPLDDLGAALAELYAGTGLRLGFASTLLFQQASGGPGDRYGGAGDLDFFTAWTLLGRETGNTGTLVVDGEYRFDIGGDPPSALGGTLGLLTNTTGGFNDRGWVVRDVHWRQRFLDGAVRLLVGRADVSDYVGGTRLQSINLFFSNRAFSANASTAFPNGHGPAAGATIAPCDLFYVTFGAANAYSNTSTIEIDSLDQGDFFWFTEFGITPEIEGVGSGRYRVFLWRMDEREELDLPEDQGLSVILEQDFGDRVLTFLRYSYSDATLTNIRNAVQAGVGVRGLLGSDADITGLAVGWAEPRSDGSRDETVIEAFHRFQLTRRLQVSVGAQLILDPSQNPDQDAIGVFTGRVRLAF